MEDLELAALVTQVEAEREEMAASRALGVVHNPEDPWPALTALNEELVRRGVIGTPLDPQAGDIALCSLGLPGVIESSQPEPVTYKDGNTGKAWLGTRLTTPRGKWASRNPRVIARQKRDGTWEPV